MRFIVNPLRLLVIVLILVPSIAHALPPDKVVRMAAGDAKYEKASLGTWTITSTDERVVKATYHDTGEVFLEAGHPGEALLLLGNKKISRFNVWKVRVGDTLPGEIRPDPSGLSGSCGCGLNGKYPVECTVKDLKCIEKIRALVKDSDLSTEEVWVLYTIPGAQALLKQMQAAMDKAGFGGVELSFMSANLRVKASVVSEEQRLKLLLAIYRIMVGKIILDDQIEIRKP